MLHLLVLVGLVPGQVLSDLVLATPDDLIGQYYNIFKTGNRNAASHLWSKFVLDHAAKMSDATLKNVFKGFCPVSGSPISNGDSSGRIYKVTLASVLGHNVTGVVRFCCSPCVCDLSENVRVDTLTVQTADGPKQYNMLVIGDPCANEVKLNESYVDPFNGQTLSLRQTAPELRCEDTALYSKHKRLVGAVYSDNGFPVIGFLWTDASELSMWTPPNQLYRDWDPSHHVHSDDPTFGWRSICQERKRAGYSSGMGLIFRLAATISPIPLQVANAEALGTSGALGGGTKLEPEPEPEPISAANSNTSMDASTSSTSNLRSTSQNHSMDASTSSCQSSFPDLLSVFGIYACFLVRRITAEA